LAGVISGNQLGIWKVGAGRDFRTLAAGELPADGRYYSAAVSRKQPWLLAVARSDGFEFWNLESGARLHFQPRTDDVRQVLFEPSGNLLTLDPAAGVSRWVVSADFARPDGLRLGPPQKLPGFPPNGYAMSQSRDGRVLAVAVREVAGNERQGGVWVLRAGEPEPMIRLGLDAAHVTVSPDGHQVAAARHHHHYLDIQDVRTGQLLRRLGQAGRAYCQFSPDGRWLATGLDGNRLWAVDGEFWTEGPRLQPGDPTQPVFSPDSRFIAHDTNAGTVRLVEAASGRELFQLPDPHLNSATPVFTLDGERLITLTNGTVPCIHVWDLNSIHRKLERMGLARK
jgi:WD40 repeat protein